MLNMATGSGEAGGGLDQDISKSAFMELQQGGMGMGYHIPPRSSYPGHYSQGDSSFVSSQQHRTAPIGYPYPLNTMNSMPPSGYPNSGSMPYGMGPYQSPSTPMSAMSSVRDRKYSMQLKSSRNRS